MHVVSSGRDAKLKRALRLDRTSDRALWRILSVDAILKVFSFALDRSRLARLTHSYNQPLRRNCTYSVAQMATMTLITRK